MPAIWITISVGGIRPMSRIRLMSQVNELKILFFRQES